MQGFLLSKLITKWFILVSFASIKESSEESEVGENSGEIERLPDGQYLVERLVAKRIKVTFC